MKRILLASAALFAVVALPALAQQAPVPATPPIVTPQPGDETTPGEAQPTVTPQAPNPQATARTETQSDATTPAPQVTAQTQAQAAAPTTESQARASLPDPSSTAPEATAQTDVTAPDATATAQSETTAPMPADASAQADTTAPTPAAQVQTAPGEATVTPATAQAVCAPRNTSVHFGARGSALSRQNQNAIEYATDAASVCNLQSVTISDSGEGRVSARRTAAVRQTLIRQGVPADRIQVEHAAEGAATGQLDVRMTFAGAAGAGAQTASNEAATTARATPGGS